MSGGSVTRGLPGSGPQGSCRSPRVVPPCLNSPSELWQPGSPPATGPHTTTWIRNYLDVWSQILQHSNEKSTFYWRFLSLCMIGNPVQVDGSPLDMRLSLTSEQFWAQHKLQTHNRHSKPKRQVFFQVLVVALVWRTDAFVGRKHERSNRRTLSAQPDADGVHTLVVKDHITTSDTKSCTKPKKDNLYRHLVGTKNFPKGFFLGERRHAKVKNWIRIFSSSYRIEEQYLLPMVTCR